MVDTRGQLFFNHDLITTSSGAITNLKGDTFELTIYPHCLTVIAFVPRSCDGGGEMDNQPSRPHVEDKQKV